MPTSIRRFSLFLLAVSSILFAGGKEFTIEDIFSSGKFASKSVRGLQWAPDGKSYSVIETDTASKSAAIFSVTVPARVKSLVVSGAMMKLNDGDPAFRFTSYQWSPDGKSILFVSAPPEKQYLSRLTPAGNLFLYDIAAKKFSRITNVSVPQYNQKFSPDGKKLGYVRENNIYVYDIASGKETAVTNDGAEHIINGKFDWVYEEEFGISDGWRWSPDGTRIAFWRLDERRVPEYTLTEWDSVHATLIPMRYPKPGDPNSIVAVGVYDLTTKATEWLDLGKNDDIYIPRIQWATDKNVLTVQRLNRAQNQLELLAFDLGKHTFQTLLTEKSEHYVEVTNDLRFLKNGNFLWSSERDGYKHLYQYKKDGSLANQITKGEWEVDAFYGVDEKNGVIYYSSSEVSPVERHLYSIRLDGSKKKQLTTQSGSHSANVSPSFEFMIESFSDVATPAKSRLLKTDGSLVATLEENNIAALKDYTLAPMSFFTFRTSDGVSLNACFIKPVDFDSTKKYPVLFYTYGGPGSQVVRNSWGGSNYLWYNLLTQKGYIICMVDNRGTGARGEAFRTVTYKNLGKWEVNDHVEAAKYLATLPFVDKGRIGIWGWSYGGYMSAMTILNGADYFKAAVAVAPVTNWKFYDNVYTERYMGTPVNNPEGYAASSPITAAEKLKGKFLLVHGTSDDNVHFQNSANLAFALQNANKPFQTMFYPNKNHGIGGMNTRLHLYNMITRFLLENL